MQELKLSLAQRVDRPASEGFRVTANRYTAALAYETRDAEGSELADVLFDNLPGGTLVAMIERLKERYSALSYQDLNPFADREES